jgi:hypothetical protein
VFGIAAIVVSSVLAQMSPGQRERARLDFTPEVQAAREAVRLEGLSKENAGKLLDYARDLAKESSAFSVTSADTAAAFVRRAAIPGAWIEVPSGRWDSPG